MMTLFEFDDPGVLVLPYHRVVGGLNATQLDQIRSRLNRMFDIEAVESGAEGVEDLLQTIAGAAAEQKTVGVAGLAESGLHLLTLKPDQEWQNWGPLAVSEGWILEEQVLKPVLGESTPQHVDYIHDHDLALAQVGLGRATTGPTVEAVSDGRVRIGGGGGAPVAPEVHLLLPQAAHRPGNQPIGRAPVAVGPPVAKNQPQPARVDRDNRVNPGSGVLRSGR